MTAPIRPEEIKRDLPDAVIDAFNRLIRQNLIGKSSKVLLSTAALEVADALGIDKAEVFRRKLLDVEDVYREAGWKVEFDKPGYNECYDAFFMFTKPVKP